MVGVLRVSRCVCTGPSSERVQFPVSDRDGSVYGRCVKSVY